MRQFSNQERRRRLGIRHHLADPAQTVEEVATSLVGLHSSDPATIYLSSRSRLADFHMAQLEEALYGRRTLVRHLGMRRTLFVVPIDVAALMDAACTRLLAPPQRRRLTGYLESQGVTGDGEKWLAAVEADTMAALRRLGPATARELSAEVPALTTKLKFGGDKSWAGVVGVSTRVLFLLATSGKIVRTKPLGTWLSSQYRWAAISDWIPDGFEEFDTAAAQAELVKLWLASYGPGTLLDLSWWTGWGKRVTRQAIDSCGAVAVDLEGQEGFALADDLEAVPEVDNWAAFLPSLDSTTMGWKERSWYLGDHQSVLFDRNGNAGPTIWLDGRVVGGWSQGSNGSIRYRLLEDVGRYASARIAEQSGELEGWFGDTRLTPRFRTPLEKELTAE
jgi:hypothetical protein